MVVYAHHTHTHTEARNLIYKKKTHTFICIEQTYKLVRIDVMVSNKIIFLGYKNTINKNMRQERFGHLWEPYTRYVALELDIDGHTYRT